MKIYWTMKEIFVATFRQLQLEQSRPYIYLKQAEKQVVQLVLHIASVWGCQIIVFGVERNDTCYSVIGTKYESQHMI